MEMAVFQSSLVGLLYCGVKGMYLCAEKGIYLFRYLKCFDLVLNILYNQRSGVTYIINVYRKKKTMLKFDRSLNVLAAVSHIDLYHCLVIPSSLH